MYNWQMEGWPQFIFEDALFTKHERTFLQNAGRIDGQFAHYSQNESNETIVNLLVSEAISSSSIEGEMLSRPDLVSSIKRQLGFETPTHFIKDQRTVGFAKLLVTSRNNFAKPLSSNMLFNWHKLLMQGQVIKNPGVWRSHSEPMQIISGSIGRETVHFEAPPSAQVNYEMEKFIRWFGAENTKNILVKSAIAHLYFESIHPFEDGNGRIGRLISEKALSFGLEKPIMFSISTIIEKKRKEYYESLKKAQKTLEVNDWILWFCEMVLEAQNSFEEIINFSIIKLKFFEKNDQKFNERQKKILSKMLETGIIFKGGMNTKKYVSITRCSIATATRDMQTLVEIGVFMPHGEGRSRSYSVII